MKNILLTVLSGLLAGIGLCGCDTGGTACSPPKFTDEYIVKNDTEKEVVISYGELWGELPDIVLGSEESETINIPREGRCFNTTLLEDLYEVDSDMSKEGYIDVTITVDGKPAPEEIWLRKHWSFEPGYFGRTYTLIITDALLAEISTVQ